MLMTSLLNWTGAVLGGGAVAWIGLSIFAPSILNVLSSWLVALAPLVKGMSEGIVDITKRLWDGFLDVFDNINTVLFVLLVAAVVAWYAHSTTSKCSCKQCVDNLRKEYKFIPKKPGSSTKDSSLWGIF